MAESIKNLAWDDFRLVKAVAEAGGMSGAADMLGLNHSTVFRRLARIELALGTTLFERHRTGYILTPAGEEMVVLAQQVDHDIIAFMSKMAGQRAKPVGELRVVTSDYLLVHLLTPLFAKFQQSIPDVPLDVVIANQDLNFFECNAVVAIQATDDPPETLVGRRAARIAWALYGRRSVFQDVRPVDLVSPSDHTWVSLGDNLAGPKVVQAERRLIAPERIVYKVTGVLGLAEAIQAGIGIGHLPCFVGDARPDLMRLGPVRPDFAEDLWLLTRPDLRQSARVRVFLDFLVKEVRKQQTAIEGIIDAEPTPI